MKKIICIIITIIIVIIIISIFFLHKPLCTSIMESGLIINLPLKFICEIDSGTILTTSVSIGIGAFITLLIFWYQEKGQEQLRLALIEIDLLSRGFSDKTYVTQQGLLYGTLYCFMDLFSSYNSYSFLDNWDKCNNLENFLNKYLSNNTVKAEAINLLNEFKSKLKPPEELNIKLENYRKFIDNCLNVKIEETSSSKNEIEYDKWIIVAGSKYEDGKVTFPKRDKEVSDKIRNNIKQIEKKICLFKEDIKKDIDIYFSEDKAQNLIVVGGPSMNKMSALLNNELPIPYAKIINYDKEQYYDYLIPRKYKEFYDFDAIKKCYTIQVIKNPYNKTDKPTRIILLFGLGRCGTEKAGEKLIKIWDKEQDFKNGIKSGNWYKIFMY